MSKRNFYMVMAMKRSGHHVFVRWLCENHKNITHHNDPMQKMEDGNFEGRQTKVYGDGSDVVVNFEDFDIDDLQIINLPKEDRVYKILFMRDYPNWLASSFKRQRHKAHQYRDVYDNLFRAHVNIRGQLKPNRIELYEKQMKEWLKQEEGIILVSYNKFISSPMYRDGIAKQLNLKNYEGEESIEEITTFGNGSSFTGVEEKTIKLYDVFSRYLEFLDNKEYKLLLVSQPELLGFSDDHLW